MKYSSFRKDIAKLTTRIISRDDGTAVSHEMRKIMLTLHSNITLFNQRKRMRLLKN